MYLLFSEFNISKFFSTLPTFLGVSGRQVQPLTGYATMLSNSMLRFSGSCNLPLWFYTIDFILSLIRLGCDNKDFSCSLVTLVLDSATCLLVCRCDATNRVLQKMCDEYVPEPLAFCTSAKLVKEISTSHMAPIDHASCQKCADK